MHPSKAQQSTTQEPDSGLRLGFTDIRAAGNDQPSGLTQQTPTKIGISSPTFDFKFARPVPQLGPEAQRMMDDLREEALRIKAKLAAEREEDKRRNGDHASGIEGRKIAQPRGKVGRFSDVHMAEFKKMDSIAGHPSAFRAQPARLTPAKTTLKRTQSKAQLDEREETSKKHEQSSENVQSERLENTAPAKRARKHVADDTSTARPVSRHETTPLPSASASSIPRSQSSMLAAVSTPTQASLARAASVKKPTTQIPTLARSPSKPNLLATPRVITKSATTHDMGVPKSESKAVPHTPSRLDRMRSILRRPSSTVKKPAQMPSSIPTLTRSPSKSNFDKSLPTIPTTPGGVSDAKVSKHVNFTPDTINKHSLVLQNSPSPVKSGLPRSTSRIQLDPRSSAIHSNISSHGSASIQYPSIASLPSLGKQTKEVEYPSLAGVRSLPQPPRRIAQPALPSVPGTFTFRSDHTISFGSSPKGFGSSPGQSSVRQVRQSLFPNEMPGSFPSSNKENTELTTVPHGMTNKKRRRVDSDDETEEEIERSPKKHKTAAAEDSMLMAPDLPSQNKTPKPTVSSPAKKKGVLSLSRLNMLARPKVRK